MSDLIAEQRPDKNGVMVTRWVKPSTGGASTKSIPAPKKAANKTDAAVKELDRFLHGYDCDFPPYSDNLREAVSRMGDYADEFVDGVELLFGASDLVFSLSDVAHRIYGDESTIPEENRSAIMKNYVSIVPEYHEDKEDYGIHAAYFAAITFDAVDGYSQDREYTDEEKTGFKAATAIAEAIFPRPNDEDLERKGFKNTEDGIKFIDRDGIDAIAENAPIADAIAEEAIRRNSLHSDVVRSIVKSGTMSRGRV